MSREYGIAPPPLGRDSSDAPSGIRAISREASKPQNNALPKKIVSVAVIDDSYFQLAHICDVLSVIKDCSVATFEKADNNVLELLATGIDLIVIDHVMPGISGIDFVRQIRSHPTMVTTPIIMLTSSTDQATIRDAFEAGVTQFQSKPINLVEFRCKVRHFLNDKRARQDGARRSTVMSTM